MFFPEGQIRVHVYGRPCGMRKSFDGLYALTKNELQQDPISGRLFVFVNRRGTQMKVLYFDRSGFCIWSKRLNTQATLKQHSRTRTNTQHSRTRTNTQGHAQIFLNTQGHAQIFLTT
ncbi:MAG: IS66 family insertion sequence element accessory protein TnpB [Rhodanobacteraceae bacterium]|nr:IS66 family insertion sequence element accessory protein TnpB [Rhodanobacteraceae bacterium]